MCVRACVHMRVCVRVCVCVCVCHGVWCGVVCMHACMCACLLVVMLMQFSLYLTTYSTFLYYCIVCIVPCVLWFQCSETLAHLCIYNRAHVLSFPFYPLSSAYTMQLILQCKHHATKKLSPSDKQKFTFTDIGRAAGGVIGKWSVDFSVILCNIGVCAGYTVFIGTNVQVGNALEDIDDIDNLWCLC